MTYPTPMASVIDVAAYILGHHGTMTAMKLQKLVYYSQAWSLVWDEAPLFDEKIEAWANGPMVRDLYDVHKGLFNVSAEDMSTGNADNLTPEQQDTVNKVLEFYGDKPSQTLSDLTHMEAPWRDARNGLPDGARSDAEITLASMHEYYSSL